MAYGARNQTEQEIQPGKEEGGGAEGKVNDHSRILVGESLLEVERVGEGEGRIECFSQRLTFKQTLVKLDATSAPATERHTRTS